MIMSPIWRISAVVRVLARAVVLTVVSAVQFMPIALRANEMAASGPSMTITLEDGRQIIIDLFVQHAPQSVAQIARLAEEGVFDNTSIWRVEANRLIQFGEGGPDSSIVAEYGIRGEYLENGVNNPLSFTPGTVGFGRLAPNSANGAVFIAAGDMTKLDGQFAAFGRVTHGLDIVTDLSRAPSKPMSETLDFIHLALQPVRINTVTVDAGGASFAEIKTYPLATEAEQQAALKSMKSVSEASQTGSDNDSSPRR